MPEILSYSEEVIHETMLAAAEKAKEPRYTLESIEKMVEQLYDTVASVCNSHRINITVPKNNAALTEELREKIIQIGLTTSDEFYVYPYLTGSDADDDAYVLRIEIKRINKDVIELLLDGTEE
ncbi:MAG: hypothetical protein LBN00_02600 [Oscillospiraceae bacterium]|jgi:hypothetical protein|nr:hypothetical protein [Oscillospiraceae bacterium]